MIFNRRFIRCKIHAIPCVFALIPVVSSILFVTDSSLFLIPFLLALALLGFVRAWRLLLLCLFLGLFSGGMMRITERNDEAISSQYGRADGVFIRVRGSIVRTFTRSAWMDVEFPRMRIELIIPKGVDMKVGERWCATGIASEIPAPRLPGAFDRKRWLEQHHIVTRLSPVSVAREGTGHPWSRFLALSESWRNRLRIILAEGSTPNDPGSGIMASLLLGDKKAMEQDSLRVFREGGCLHIFAVSGLHTGFAAGIFFLFFSFFRLRPATTRLLTLLPLSAYVFVTGMPVSAMRAFVMVCLFFLGTAIRRKTNSMNIMAFTAIAFLLVDPMALYDAGFLLSFLVFAAVVVTGTWETRRPAWWAPDPFIPKRIYTWRERQMVRLESHARTAVIVSIVCWIVSAFVTISCFGTLNLYAAALNIALVPLVPAVMGSCMAGILFFWCHPALLFFNEISRNLSSLLLWISSMASDQPGALLYPTPPAKPWEAIVIPHSSRSFTLICGNPAIVINPGTSDHVLHSLIPVLNSLGFSPWSSLNTHTSPASREGMKTLMKGFPEISPPLASPGAVSFNLGGSGVMSVYPPSQMISTGITDDRQPTIIWECAGKRLLYAASASWLTCERLMREIGKVDILVLGFHAKDPANEAALLTASGAANVIFMPNEKTPPLPPLPDSIRTWDLKDEGVLLIDLKAGTVTPVGTKNRTR